MPPDKGAMSKLAKPVKKCWYCHFSPHARSYYRYRVKCHRDLRNTGTAGSLEHRTPCLLCFRLKSVLLHFKYYDKELMFQRQSEVKQVVHWVTEYSKQHGQTAVATQNFNYSNSYNKKSISIVKNVQVFYPATIK